MYYRMAIALAACITHVHSHGAIIAVQGTSGPTGQGFLVDQTLARNCTTISPCQQDSTIIRNSEITQNIVNSCGRTEIAGNIDVGEQTENELAANRVAQVTQGGVMTVTIHQVNADGAGPYECDLDQTSNAATNFIPLKVANNVPGSNGLSSAKEQDFTINVQMPANFNCIGASTGDICTVRCRNNAVAGPFGGCFAVQQTDGTGRTNTSAAGANGGNEGAAAISALVTATAVTPAATQNAGAGNAANGNGNNRNGGNRGNAGNVNAGIANTGNANAGSAAAGNANAGNTANANTGAANAGNTNANTGNAANGNVRGGRNRGGNNRRQPRFLFGGLP